MRKKFLALAIGITAAMMAGGCSGKGGEGETEAVQAEAAMPETARTETGGGQEGDGTMPDSVEDSSHAGEDTGSGEAKEGPVKITGTILEAGQDGILADSGPGGGYVGEIMLLIDPENTLVLDGADGFPVELKDVGKGSFEAYLGPAMTMSLPPQNTPYVVIVNIPEDGQAPQYVIAGGAVDAEEGRQTLTGVDGTKYPLAGDVDIKPYLTRNIVRLEDIGSGSRCLVWTNEEGEADRIVLFGE